jgi:hypothetical protein
MVGCQGTVQNIKGSKPGIKFIVSLHPHLVSGKGSWRCFRGPSVVGAASPAKVYQGSK